MTRWLVPALGVLLALIGLVWVLQGVGIMGGSMMTGSRLWLVIGLVALVVGVTLLFTTLRARKP